MGKAAARRKVTTTTEESLQQSLEMLDAKKLLVGSTINMGWRLAITVVVPIVIGVKLDEHFHAAPSYTLSGLILAAAAGTAAVWSTIKEVNQLQAIPNRKRKRRRAT